MVQVTWGFELSSTRIAFILTILSTSGRRLSWDVYDWWPEKVLHGHEENVIKGSPEINS